jgi:hypothetical protein
MRGLGIAAVMLLAACGQKSQSSGSNVVAGTPTRIAAETAGANSGANAAINEAGAVPPANAVMRYVGSWARSKADCASNPWRFTLKSLKATGGPQCSFYNVAKAPGGYDIGAECPTKLPIHEDLIKLRFAESAGAMLIESNAIPPTGLIYCGR